MRGGRVAGPHAFHRHCFPYLANPDRESHPAYFRWEISPAKRRRASDDWGREDDRAVKRARVDDLDVQHKPLTRLRFGRHSTPVSLRKTAHDFRPVRHPPRSSVNNSRTSMPVASSRSFPISRLFATRLPSTRSGLPIIAALFLSRAPLLREPPDVIGPSRSPWPLAWQGSKSHSSQWSTLGSFALGMVFPFVFVAWQMFPLFLSRCP